MSPSWCAVFGLIFIASGVNYWLQRLSSLQNMHYIYYCLPPNSAATFSWHFHTDFGGETLGSCISMKRMQDECGESLDDL